MIVQNRLHAFIQEHRRMIEDEMISLLSELAIPRRLKESMLYSLESGGKRLRPVLLAASFLAYSTDITKIVRTSIALELVHTYSLIHDDLPAMDDDDVRRGKPTNHKVFDEATAILAGDALLTYSFELIASDAHLHDEQKVFLINQLSRASGPKGMVAGQILDLKAENEHTTLEQLERIHAFKTGELFKFAIKAGAYIGKAAKDQLQFLDDYAYYLGLIFQVQDDILDVIGDARKLGKPIGSDESKQKSTYPKLLGIEGAKKQKDIYVFKAKKALENAGAEKSYLMDLTDYFSERDR